MALRAIYIQGESKKTGISKILNFVWGPLKCTKLNFYPMHIFSPLRDIWFNGITMDFSFKNEWVIAIWKFWDPSFFLLTLYVSRYLDTPDTGLDANTDQTDQPWLTLWQTYYNSMFLSQHDCWIAVWDLIAIMSGVFYRALSTARFYSPSSTGSSRCPPRISFSWWRVRRHHWTACWILRMLTWTWLLAWNLCLWML